LHDFEVDLEGGTVAAIEVTGEVDPQRLRLAAAAARRLDSLKLVGSASFWLVGLAPNAVVNQIGRDVLRQLLTDIEAGGRRSAHNIGDFRDPFVARLSSLGIESIYAMPARAGHEGDVLVQPGVYGGWGWGGQQVDQWLGDLLNSNQGQNKLEKLRRAAAAQRHLVVVLDSFSPAGMGIPLGLTARRERGAEEYTMPSLVPPEPLTHLWVLPPPVASWEGLHWSSNNGWVVLEAWTPTP